MIWDLDTLRRARHAYLGKEERLITIYKCLKVYTMQEGEDLFHVELKAAQKC